MKFTELYEQTINERQYKDKKLRKITDVLSQIESSVVQDDKRSLDFETSYSFDKFQKIVKKAGINITRDDFKYFQDHPERDYYNDEVYISYDENDDTVSVDDPWDI